MTSWTRFVLTLTFPRQGKCSLLKHMVSFRQYFNFNLFCTPLWLGNLWGPWTPELEADLMKAFLDSVANGWTAHHSFRDSNENLNWKICHQHLWFWMASYGVNLGGVLSLLLLCRPGTYILLKWENLTFNYESYGDFSFWGQKVSAFLA